MKKPLLFLAVFTLGTLPLALRKTRSPGWGNARWVWDQADAAGAAQTDEPRYLRRTFTLAGKPAKAELWITADNEYTVYVNGQQVGHGSEWSKVDRYDVAKHLAAGKNVLAIVARNHGGPAGIIARLHVVTAGKKNLFVVTDDQTRITQIANPDWLKRDFDDRAWPTVAILGDAGIGPWNIAGNVAERQHAKLPVPGRRSEDHAAAEAAQEQLKHFILPKDSRSSWSPPIRSSSTRSRWRSTSKGRIYVSESHTYRYGPPGSPIKPYANPVVRLDPLPDGKGGFTRTLIADGFADPVMGIAVKGDKLWLTREQLPLHLRPPAPRRRPSRPAGKSPSPPTRKPSSSTRTRPGTPSACSSSNGAPTASST